MAWVRLQPEMIHHPKMIGLSDAAFALHIRALCYCVAHLTDGLVPRAAVKLLGQGKAIKELTEAGAWQPDQDGYRIHDYAVYQPSRAEVQAARAKVYAARSAAGRIGMANRWDPTGETPKNGGGETEQTPDEAPKIGQADNGFARWWETYPKKVGRRAAEKIWVKLAPTPEMVEHMLAILARQKATRAWQDKGGAYVPHPRTYLYHARYEDEDIDLGGAGQGESPDGLASWDWCHACQDAHQIGLCPVKCA